MGRRPTKLQTKERRVVDLTPQTKTYDPIALLTQSDEILYMVTCVFSPSQFKSRYNRYNQFAAYIATFPNVRLYTVELTIKDQPFTVTDPNNPFHLQLRAFHPLWYKENILNILIKSLPPEAKKIAVVDGDVQWDEDDWAEKTLRALDEYPVVQMLATWQNLDENDKPTMPAARGFAQRYVKGTQKEGDNGFTGLAWAWRRDELEQLGGLIDVGILGSGDYFMANALIGKNRSDAGVIDVVAEPDLQHFVVHLDEALAPWIAKAEKVIKRNIGYVDLHIRHFFHGKKSDRGYNWRYRILVKYDFRAKRNLRYNEHGIIMLIGMPDPFYVDVQGYFDSRNEDNPHNKDKPIVL